MNKMKFVKECFTEADNETWDIGRVLWVMGTLTYIIVSAHAGWLHPDHWDMQSFGVGLGAVLAAGGGMIWMKGKEQ